MNKHLTITDNGKEYVLEFTRRTVQQMEQQGFSIEDLDKKPMSTLPKLFAGAFLANHRFVRKEDIDDIYSRMTGKAELITKLAEMYSEPIAALVEDPEESEGNVTWKADW